MSDSEDDEAETPTVALGEGPVVEGAPLARVASRLTWPIERRRLLAREGETAIRTPDGPRTVADAMASVDVTYFDTRRTFIDAVREAVGSGPVPTAGESDDGTETAAPTDGDGGASANGTGGEEPTNDDGNGETPADGDDRENGA
ncbi:hypothetical protein BRD13_00730 [Halobacteriales archaeon SW_5_70_135]|nr:MAG: hypothetical protein BRD13_00730 [Halobacteriales archaeon SW_5_70_135]